MSSTSVAVRLRLAALFAAFIVLIVLVLPASARADAPSACDSTYSSLATFRTAAKSTSNSGKTLCITTGSWGDLDLGGVDMSSETTLAPVPGDDVTFGSVDMSDTTNIRLYGMTVTDGVSAYGSEDGVVEGNSIASPGGYAVDATDRPWGLQVLRNRFGTADFDIRMNWNDYWTGTQPSGVVIAGNDFPGDLADGYQITSVELGGNPIGVQYIGNTCHDNEETGHHQDCIQLVGATNTLIEGNVFRNVSSAVMLPGHDGPNTPTNIIDNIYDNANYICDCGEMGHSLVAGNTFVAGGNTGGGMLLSDDSDDPTDTAPSRITMIDNIFVLGNHWLVGGNLLGAQVDQDYNIAPGNTEGAHDINAQPKFVNAGAHDYRLASDSPGIDAGTSTGAPTADILGNSRVDDPDVTNTGGGTTPYYDIGAYEYSPDQPPSPPPTPPTQPLPPPPFDPPAQPPGSDPPHDPSTGSGSGSGPGAGQSGAGQAGSGNGAGQAGGPVLHLKRLRVHGAKHSRHRLVVLVRATDAGGKIKSVRFRVAGRLIRVDRKAPFKLNWRIPKRLRHGRHRLVVVAVDDMGRTGHATLRFGSVGI